MNNTTMNPMMTMDNVTMHPMAHNSTHPHHHHSTMDHSGHHSTMDHGHHGTTMDHGHHGTTMDHSGHGDGAHGAHEMKMYFHGGVMEYILFETLHTHTTGGMVGACFAMFALSVMYEGLKYFREYLLREAAQRHEKYSPSTAPNGEVTTRQPGIGSRMLSGSHGLQTFLHMVQVFVSYCLMLVFMTYNVYLCIAVVVGAGTGYFLFGWRRAMVVDMNEHCH